MNEKYVVKGPDGEYLARKTRGRSTRTDERGFMWSTDLQAARVFTLVRQAYCNARAVGGVVVQFNRTEVKKVAVRDCVSGSQKGYPDGEG